MVAPIAPIDPAWLTVAIPKSIDPKTAKIKARGGIITIKTLIQNFESKFPLNGTGGAALGFSLALQIHKSYTNQPKLNQVIMPPKTYLLQR